MTHTTDKLREELERWATNFILEANIAHLTEDGGNSFKSELMDYLVEKLVVKLETTLKDRESAGRVTKINGKTYVEINGVVDEIEIISNAQVHRLSLHTDTNSENK